MVVIYAEYIVTLFLTRNKILFICNTRLVIVFQIYRYSNKKRWCYTCGIFVENELYSAVFYDCFITFYRSTSFHVYMTIVCKTFIQIYNFYNTCFNRSFCILFFAIYTYIHADFTALRQIMSFKHYDPFTIIHNPGFALNTLNTVKYNMEINDRERKMGTNFQTKYIFFPNRVIQLHVSLKYVQPNAQYRLWGATIWIQSSLNTSVGFL